MISNVDDLLKWHKGLHSFRILRKATLEKAFIPYKLKNGISTGYGYVWFLKTSNGIRTIEHEGGLPGFLANEVYFPDKDIFIAILCNNGTAPIDEMSINISNIASGKSLQADINVDAKKLDKYVGVYKLT